ncbi:MAG: ABC transporter ATP-binding protein [Marinagarivorans sp.]
MQNPTQGAPAIVLKDVVFRWHKSQPPVLHIPHLQIAQHQHLFLYGPSGAGKTSLLNIIAGINLPTAGQVEVLGQELGVLSAARRDQFRAHYLGIIFQQFNLIPYLSVLDNLLLKAQFSRQFSQAGSSKAVLDSAQELLAQLGLSPLIHQKAHSLSLGQQQRVAVARALINKPPLIIADEPTSALDSDNRDNFMQLLLTSAHKHNSTIIFVSHDKTLQSHFNQALDIRSFNPGYTGGSGHVI